MIKSCEIIAPAKGENTCGGTGGWSLAKLDGRGRLALSIALGASAALAFPPLDLIPLFFIALPVMLRLLNSVRSSMEAFWNGWGFALGYFTLGLYWISNALTVDLERWWWLWPFAILGLPAGLACFHGLAAVAYHWLIRTWRLQAEGSALLFAGLWSVAEWLRGHILTGLPWQLAGYIWDAIPQMLQLTSVFGIYGLGLVTVCVAVLPAVFARATARRSIIVLLAGWGVLAAGFGYGGWRLGTPVLDPVPQLAVLLVQPNIAQDTKWLPEYREGHFRWQLDLTREAVAKLGEAPPATVVIWPEAASTFLLEQGQDDRRRQAIAQVLPTRGLALIGTSRARWQDSQAHYWNSLLAIDPDGQVVASYDKFHLVPFGEYIPLQSWLQSWLPMGAIASNGVVFSAGPGNRTVMVEGFPAFSPLICYEAIFPGEVVDSSDPARWLLNISDDSWYGNSSGPYQHFAIARVRAIEEGLPLVRVANTGISGVVDPYGRILAQQPLGSAGVITASLPSPLQATLYARYGDLIFLGMLGLVVVPMVLSWLVLSWLVQRKVGTTQG